MAWEELTPAQAAVSLGISAVAFRVRLHRASRRCPSTTSSNVGKAELWFGTSRQGGFCTAIRLPDGEWAGTYTRAL